MFVSNRTVVSIIMIHGALLSICRRTAVRAFSTTAAVTSNTALFVSTTTTTTTISRTTRSSIPNSRRFLSATVEEDLDAALDSILNEQKSNASKKLKLVQEVHIEGAKPIPSTLIEEDDPIDFKDPKFLSTSNPRWTQPGRLDPKIIDVLSAKGITSFTPVQAEAFDPILARRDVIGRSRTGTGKTLAFGMPTLTRLCKILEEKGFRNPHNGRMERGRPVSMLILCPTRELAKQVQEELSTIAEPLNLYVDCFHGGVSYGPQASALRHGVDVLVGTPGRIMDHLDRGNLNLFDCEIAVLDEADEMLNMGFAEDVEFILQDIGKNNPHKTQCLLFSATTPPWVKEIGKQYQTDVLAIDSTSEEGGARVAKTVRHTAVQVPPGQESKTSILEDIIAVEISKDKKHDDEYFITNSDSDSNPIAAAALAKKQKTNHAMQQKIFGKTIVFVETKRMADELVSGSVFKSLTAQALHGDVGQKQREATLAAFRKGAFNVLVATDVAARGIDIKDVDLVVQFDPPRDVDTYVHRSGRTGRAGQKGVSVLLFNRAQARDIVRIERDLGHGFKFELVGPPSTEAALKAAAKTSAIACKGIPDETAKFFTESAAALLEEYDGNAQDVIARCLAAISRRSTEVESRSLITGEVGRATVEMRNSRGRSLAPNDVMFTVSKLARMSRRDGDTDISFESDIGKIQANPDGSASAFFDMSIEDAKRLVAFSKDIDAGGSEFSLVTEMEIERDRFFGKDFDRRGRSGGPGGGRFNDRRGGGGRFNDRGPPRRNGRWNDNNSGGSGGGGYNGRFRSDHAHTGRSNRNFDRRGGGGGGRGNDSYGGGSGGGNFRGRYDNNKSFNRGGGGGGDNGW